MNRKRIITIAVLIAIIISGGIKINSTKVYAADTDLQQIIVQPSIIVIPREEEPSVNQKFNDVKNTDWHFKYVSYLSEKEYLNGYTDGTFKPDNNITVAEFIKIIISTNGNKIKSAEGNISWYTTFVEEAERMGLILAGDFTKSDYNSNITRGEMARIIARGTDLMINQPEIKNPLDDYKRLISDYSNIPESLQNFILKAYARGIISGYPDGTFKYDQNATRAEACVMINKFLELDLRTIPEVKEAISTATTSDNNEVLLNADGFPLDLETGEIMKSTFPPEIMSETPIDIVNKEAIDYYVKTMDYLNSTNYDIKVVNNFESITLYIMKDIEKDANTYYYGGSSYTLYKGELGASFYFKPQGTKLDYPYYISFKQASEESKQVLKDLLKMYYPTSYMELYDKMMYMYDNRNTLFGTKGQHEEGIKDNRGYFVGLDKDGKLSISIGK